MKKVLISLTVVGVISIIGIASVRALAFNDKASYASHHNYVDTNNDGRCDNRSNHHNATTGNHHQHRHGHN